MKEPDEVRRDFVQQWLDKADNDFGLAKYLLDENTSYFEAIGLHAQQAAENYLKAFLVNHQIEFPKTHNLGELLDLMKAVDPVLVEKLKGITILNPYAIDYRYPTDVPTMTIDDATKTVEIAEMVRDRICDALM